MHAIPTPTTMENEIAPWSFRTLTRSILKALGSLPGLIPGENPSSREMTISLAKESLTSAAGHLGKMASNMLPTAVLVRSLEKLI